jgi:hypothetical protein
MENKEEVPGYCLSFYQRNPRAKPTIQAILSCENAEIFVQMKDSKRKYKSASLVTPDGHPILANSLNYLKELSRQSTLSQITYEYTENIDRVKEYLELLLQT